MKGKFILIVGPSASGKTEMVKALLSRVPDSIRLVTTTTRARREGEGDDYFFVTKKEFEEGIKNNEFFEYAEVYGNLYGCSKRILNEYLQKYPYVFAIIDVKGAQVIKSQLPETKVIFLKVGTLQDIKDRLLKVRADVSKEELQKRLDTAQYELSLAETFDFVIDNPEGHFDMAVEKVVNLLTISQY